MGVRVGPEIEYLVVELTLERELLQRKLTELGKEGWQLVHVFQLGGSIFMREVLES